MKRTTQHFEKRRLERVRYWQGQMLRSADLRALVADTAQHRWWHNRALHEAFGVYQGLEASAVNAGGKLTGISVAPGAGYDCFGRELVLESEQTIHLPTDIPKPPFTINLVISYGVEDGQARSNHDEICWTNAGTQSSRTIAFSWIRTERMNRADGVPLCTIRYDEKGTATMKSGARRRGGSPVARKPVAFAVTMPETTVWKPWTIDLGPKPALDEPTQALVGVKTRIDTSEAGFTNTPCYFAWLTGPLLDARGVLLPDLFTSIDEETSTGFTFRMWFPPERLDIVINLLKAMPALKGAFTVMRMPRAPSEVAEFFPRFLRFAKRQRLCVTWIASQMPPMVPFIPLQLRFFNQSLLPLLVGRAFQPSMIMTSIKVK